MNLLKILTKQKILLRYMNKEKKGIAQIAIVAIVIGVTIFSVASFVRADAWWGEGYRPQNWVLLNGGTIVNYSIVDGKGGDSKYKARMTRDGAYVEVEFGRSGMFDDAKDGLYTIVFYKCKNCEDQKFDHKSKVRDKDKIFASISFNATSGKNCQITANADTGIVSTSCSGGKPAVPEKTDHEIAMEAVEENVGKITAMTFQENTRVHQFLTPFLHNNNSFHLPYYIQANLLMPQAVHADEVEEREG